MSDNVTFTRNPVTGLLEGTRSPTSTPGTSGQLWLRNFSLTLEKPAAPSTTISIDIGHDPESLSQDNTVVSLADFHCIFEVEQSQTQFPWKLTATVYNVPFDWMNALKEYSVASLYAGYQKVGHPGGGDLLFSGNVVWFERGREDAVNTYLRIYAASFDDAINTSLVNTTLPAGHTQNDVVGKCVDAMQDANSANTKVTVGKVTDLGSTQSPRGRTLYGTPNAILRDVAQTCGAQNHVDDGGKVNILKPGDTLPNPPAVLNSKTGMIGIPHQNLDGSISVTSLMNASLRPGTQVQINEPDITRQIPSKATTDSTGTGGAQETKTVLLNDQYITGANGTYTIWSVMHHGDTRGIPWYSEVTTLPVTPAPVSATNG